MGRRGRIVVVTVFVALTLASACVPDPPAPVRIGPHQRFSGRVNGQDDGAVVYTACAGPVWPGRMGAIVGGQTVSVVADPTGDGDTGTSSVVFAQPGQNNVIVTVDTYDTPVEMPVGVDAPCDGSGTVTFHQCWGIIACTSGAPDVVKVQFVNIAD
ncbi:MAG: hypothetical protein U0Q22_05000 [Acidimicrobiales bacterium]